MQNMDILCLKWTIFVSLLSNGVSQMLCPYVAELKSTSHLICIFSTTEYILYKRTDRETMASCFSDRASCIINADRDRLNGTVVNATHSVLEIQEVQQSDEGEWICEDKEMERTRCDLVLKKTPSCRITTDRNTSELYVGDEITMIVLIEDFYCTIPAVFNLKMGTKTMDLIETENNVFSSNLNLTDSHFGLVKLSFTCDRSTEDVSCGGITYINKNPVTTTTLHSTSCCRTKTESADLKENKIAVIAVTIAAVALIVTIIISVCFCVKVRGKSSKTVHTKKESCPYADVADSINILPRGIRVDAEGYAEISEIKGSFSNHAFDKGSVETTDEFTVIPSRGYVSVDKFKKENPQLYKSHLSKQTQIFTLEDVYSNFPCEQEKHRCEC